MNKKIIYILTICVLVLSLVTGCTVGGLISGGDEPGDETATMSEILQTLGESNITVQTVNTDVVYDSIADMVAEIKDSVVEIETVISTENKTGTGAGSGVLFGISQDKYYVITNHHVVDDATMIWVRLTNGKRYSASFIASDENTDVAVLTISNVGIDQNKFKTVIIPADDYQTRVGDTAIAIGNPLGSLGGSVTQGIISALDRQITIDGITMTVLQTDAASNPGNSGGGLFDEYGQLIGITNSGVTVEGVEGINFAIPVKTVVTAACDLIEQGYVTGKPSIGMRALSFTSMEEIDEFYLSLSISQRQVWYEYFSNTNNALGVYVYLVENPYCELEEGDYIVSFNGVEITSGEELSVALSSCSVGQTVSITVNRGGELKSVNVTLVEMRVTE